MTTMPLWVPETDVRSFGPDNTYRWATVTQLSPLRVRFDGDTDELPVTPESLISTTLLTVGKRVWVQMFGRRLIVLGASGGEITAQDDTGWVSASTAGFTGDQATLTGGIVRRKNGVVAIQLTGALAAAMGAGNIGNTNLWGIPAGWIPAQSNGSFDAGASGSSWTGYASTAGVIVASNSGLAKAAGETIQAMGTYML